MMRRREFTTLLGGAAAWPLAARAQQQGGLPVRRIGILMSARSVELEARVTVFRQRLEALGWSEGRNLQIDLRWDAIEPEQARALATQLLSRAPDLIVVGNPIPLEAVLQLSRAVAVLFLSITDPVEMGYVQSYSRPGGNVTGFTNFETQTAAKWVELLKEISPRTTRAMVIMQSPTRAMRTMLGVIENKASSLGIVLQSTEIRSAAEIERAVESFARERDGGLIVHVGPILAHREPIVGQAVRHKLPAVYPFRFYIESGGLISYGVDGIDIYRRGSAYADRILRGEQPSSLPIQNPTKCELVINLRTAKALGLDIPPTLLAIADEVIE